MKYRNTCRLHRLRTLALTFAAQAQRNFAPLDDLPGDGFESSVQGVSGDGSVVGRCRI